MKLRRMELRRTKSVTVFWATLYILPIVNIVIIIILTIAVARCSCWCNARVHLLHVAWMK